MVYCEEGYKGKPIYDVDSIEGIVRGEMPKTLVSWKCPSAPKKPKEEDWLHTNMYYTSCTKKCKVCGMIIDRGSHENLI